MNLKKKIKNILLKDEINILFLSNFIKSKGYIELLRAASLLKEHKEIKFHFAGHFFEEEDRKEFLNTIENLDINNVKFHGIVKGKQKKKLLESCDIFALPTYYHIEGQPISIIEAMANGLSIITTNHAGIPDIVSDDNGIFVRKKNSLDIAEAIKLLVSDRKKMSEMAVENRNHVMNNYLEKHYIERISSIFEESISIEKN